MKRLPLYPEAPIPPIQGVPPLDQNPACSLCKLAEHNPVGERCVPAEGKPGDILVISDYPGEHERRLQRPMAGPAGRWLHELLKRVAPGRDVVFTNAINCLPGKPTDLDEYAVACRGYVARVLEECQPKVVLLMGGYAGVSFLGRSYQPLSVRTGYSWCFKLEEGELRGVPVFLMPNPAAAVRNPLIAQAFEADLLRNLAVASSLKPIQLDAIYSVVENEEDSREALEQLRKAPVVATDVETSGVMFEDDFRIECLSISDGTDTFVWPRSTLEDEKAMTWLDMALAELDHTSWNGQYDYCAIECEPQIDARYEKPAHHPGGKLNLQSDARLKRKLYEADARADLSTAADLVGMGGHKEENEAIVGTIEVELHKLALSTTKTPTGKTRKPPALHYVRPEEFHPRWIEKLNQGFSPKMFAHRFVPEEVELRYNARDAYTTWHLEAWANERLLEFANEEDDGLLTIWAEVVQPAMWAYCRMRIHGFPVSKDYLKAFQEYLEADIERTQKKIDAYCPGLNPESPKQVLAYLSSVGIVPSRKTDSGLPSTSDEALEDYVDKHPMVDLILQHRELVKQLGTYAVGLSQYICSDGRVHPTVLQDGTDCLPAGELILTHRGYLPVEQVRVGDLVLTHLGRPRPVVETKTFPKSPIYQVTLQNGCTLRSTGNHKYLMSDGAWVRADQLSSGSVVATHGAAEVWAEIKGWPYEVSSWGRVRSQKTGKPIAQMKKGRWGHLKVSLNRNGARLRGPDWRDFSVHRLVLSGFCPQTGPEVRHKNGIAWDNTLSNLEWGTSNDNKRDARKHGTMSHRKGHGQVKLSEEAVEALRAVGRSALSDRAAAEVLGVSRELVRDVRLGKRWNPEQHVQGKKAEFSTSMVVEVTQLPPAVSYGLVVEEDHSHVTAGIVTHNTGRASCKEPNLFNQSKGRTVRKRILANMLRASFIAPPGWTFIDADEGQIEIRGAAHLSGDPAMLEMLTSGTDFHQQSAERFAVAQGKDPTKVTDIDRDNAKQSNFAAVYEIPSELGFMLASRLKIDKKAGVALGNAMFKIYIKLLDFMAESYATAWEKGWTRTTWKGKPARRRPLWGLGNNPATLEKLQDQIAQEKKTRLPSRLDKNAARSSYNTAVQGSSVDIVASMLWKVQQWLDQNTDGGQFVLHVYDSIVLLVRDADVEKTVKFLVALMRDDAGTEKYLGDVPLLVDVKVGPTMGSMTKVKPS